MAEPQRPIRDVGPDLPLKKMVEWLDEAFQVPGTKFRIGWDSIIGLIPGLGELIMLLLQCGVVLYMIAKYPIPKVVAARMVFNVFIDSFIGSVPLVGDIFDMFFKANTRNLALLEEVRIKSERGMPIPTAKHIAFFGTIAIVLLSIVAGTIFLAVAIIRAILTLF